MAGRNGVSILRNSSLQLKVSVYKYEKAKVMSAQDLRIEWKGGMKDHIDLIIDRLSQLKTGNQDVVVSPYVTEEQWDKLHTKLEILLLG